MTRNDFIKLAKSMVLGMCCAIPLVVIVSVLLSGVIASIAVICINVALMICGGVAGYFFSIYKEERIKKKRAEYLAREHGKKEKEVRNGTNNTIKQ